VISSAGLLIGVAGLAIYTVKFGGLSFASTTTAQGVTQTMALALLLALIAACVYELRRLLVGPTSDTARVQDDLRPRPRQSHDDPT
jgi:Na+/proline symporter